ncbi:MAG: glutamate--tRNA ligase [Thermonemataceae bacterium]
MDNPVRVRFAPSPTGGLHIGGVRTALYNYLLAKQTGGQFIIRIEDTDQSRFVQGAEQYIYEALSWLGIEADESPQKGGEWGPYTQSERKEIYQKYAKQLLRNGHAYYAFDTTEELEAMRDRLVAAKSKNPSYNAISRMQMKNSLTLPEDDVAARLASGDPYVIRLKVPHKQQVRFNDLVRGWVMVHSSAIDDKVLMKSDGMPTYHLANIVDDHMMKITHVIRGEEWLPSAPLHILLYQCLGWKTPQFAHLPLILRPDGNGKLSKRVADDLGFPIFPLNWTDDQGNQSEGYKEKGYLPEALVNFLAFLGWNPGDNQELFSMEALIETFSVARIGKSGAKFDIEKAKWFNQQYLRAKPNETLLSYLKAGLEANQIDYSRYTEAQLLQICELMKERATFPNDLWKDAQFLFSAPTHYDEKVIHKKWNERVVDVLKGFQKSVEELDNYTGEKAKATLHELIEQEGLKLGQLMPALRVTLTGVGAGPDLGSIMDILGKEEVINRLDKAFEVISIPVK